jgi:hypothetical protein
VVKLAGKWGLKIFEEMLFLKVSEQSMCRAARLVFCFCLLKYKNNRNKIFFQAERFKPLNGIRTLNPDKHCTLPD